MRWEGTHQPAVVLSGDGDEGELGLWAGGEDRGAEEVGLVVADGQAVGGVVRGEKNFLLDHPQEVRSPPGEKMEGHLRGKKWRNFCVPPRPFFPHPRES